LSSFLGYEKYDSAGWGSGLRRCAVVAVSPKLYYTNRVYLRCFVKQPNEGEWAMKNFLTIGEFARLRGVNVNSLLYYEKLGILLPAYVDPHSKYRYYAPEQLSTLDIILLCINLDIPLKQLQQYQKEGCYWQAKMLEDGKRIAEDKIRKMKTDLKKIEYVLKCRDDQETYSSCCGIYKREIPPRYFIVEQYIGNLDNMPQFGRISTGLFDYAESRGLSTILPTGFMFIFDASAMRQYLFYEILPPTVEDEKIMKIPGGVYTCLQLEFRPDVNYDQFLPQRFGAAEKRIAIVSNLIRDRLHIDSRYNEIQVIDGYTLPDGGN
ncbi:MAG: MerR family DNA-binding transcriptional regulator, partial [Oscillospiraceae bacterium]|nr:MerR family DNA-binding transcriptional regulator [Oscillospiraceae bacterium]